MRISLKIKNLFISLFFKLVVKPIDFLVQIANAVKSKPHAFLWAILLFLCAITAGKLVFTEVNKHYSVGMDLSAVSSNDQVFFTIKKNESLMSELKRNDYVAFDSGFLAPIVKKDMTVIKQIKGLPKDEILVKDGLVYVNGEKVAEIHSNAMKKLNKPKNGFDRKETVPENHIFVIGSHPRSYDSRYWGFLKVEDKISRAYPFLF
jgi:conjugal transfer pilin signal peptidase TrbI